MRHLATFIDEQIRVQETDAKSLAERMEIDPVIISRIRQGRQRAFDHKTIVKMVTGISDNPDVRTGFAVAMALDFIEAMPGIDPEVISIEVDGKVREARAQPYGASAIVSRDAALRYGLSPKTVAAAEKLLRAAKGRGPIERAITALAAMLPAEGEDEEPDGGGLTLAAAA